MMWTGDMQSSYPTQWALNPSAYQNLPNEQVDWATLAQQWIKMKETFPVDQIPPAPPPPSIKEDIEEAGEAPMEMSKDEVTPTSQVSSTQENSNWNSWNSWQQWNWGWSGSGSGPPPSSSSSVPPEKTSVPPYNYTPPTTTPSYSIETPTTFDYNHGATVPENFDQQGYWSGGPAPFVRNKASEWRGESRVSSSRRQPSKIEEIDQDTTTIIDAAKRKSLPAWIREGLEKMEREKQKKIERERQLKEREEELLRRKQQEEEAIAAGIPVKSKFDTDSEESDKEVEETIVKPRRSRFDATSPLPPKSAITKSSSPPPTIKLKSREEILQDVMLQVKYALTDILMTVTNEEMQKVAEEVLADFRAKAPATQLRKTPALTSLTGKLGLGIYDSDSEESSAESDNDASTKQENGVDSDEELRERINRKKQEFARIERDIEHQVEQQEEREREREQKSVEDVEDSPEYTVDQDQVEPKLGYPGIRLDVKKEEDETIIETQNDEEQTQSESFTPDRSYKTEKDSSEEHTEESEQNSSSRSESSSRSSSSSRHRKSRKSSKRRKEKKSSKRKRKRSSSRGSERRRSSHRKSSRRYEERHRNEHSHSRSHTRSRSRSRGHYEEYRHKRSPSYRRYSSESSHKRRHHSYSHSPDYSRGKKSSYRSRD